MDEEEELRRKLEEAKRLLMVADAHLRLYFYDPGSDELSREKARSEWVAATDILWQAMQTCVENPQTAKRVTVELSEVIAAAESFDRSLGSTLGSLLRGLESTDE
ncbi:MAG: hypothetical protein QOI57_2186 [Rubrobacteraceae bacterium]|nr:hypothetical protein [Rubrobacteraceae bacterium]